MWLRFKKAILFGHSIVFSGYWQEWAGKQPILLSLTSATIVYYVCYKTTDMKL